MVDPKRSDDYPLLFSFSELSEGLKGDEIPVETRIMAIADVFKALVSKRCYKEAAPIKEAFNIMENGAGTHFDPQLIALFLKYKENTLRLIIVYKIRKIIIYHYLYFLFCVCKRHLDNVFYM